MAETQSSSLSGTIHAAIIESLVIAYQYDDVVATPYFRYKSLVDQTTTVATFPRMVKSTGPTAGTPASEVTALGTTALTTTSADLTIARVGIARELTTTAAEDSVVGRALWINGFVMDAARLYGEFFDTASTALFTSVTATKGASGSTLDIATMVDVVASQRVNKAKGPQVGVIHDNQGKQLQQAQAAQAGTAWATFFSPSGDGGSFLGYFLNAPLFASGLCPTSTGDRVGAMWTDGQARPEYCAFGFAVKRLPSSLTESNILMDSNIWASFSRTAVGIIANNFATSIRSVNA
jgi:hypothetical protein